MSTAVASLGGSTHALAANSRCGTAIAMYMTTTINPANNLRAALKQAGFGTRKVTVRQHHSTLYVTLRDASASLTQVTEIAGRFEQVRRDHATGEILCGGNTFVRVEFHYRNNIAVGVSWAAERLAVARLDANALAQGSTS
jgi:hypothetical protein